MKTLGAMTWRYDILFIGLLSLATKVPQIVGGIRLNLKLPREDSNSDSSAHIGADAMSKSTMLCSEGMQARLVKLKKLTE